MRSRAAAIVLVISSALISSALAAFTAPAAAEPQFPARPVKFIVPFLGGGSTDVAARIAGDKLQAKWGQPVVVENRAGAGGNIGADAAAKAEPDGHTLFISPPGPLAINQSLYRQLSYKPEDFVPVTVLASVTNLITVRPEIGGSVADLISLAQQNPGKITYGSQGNGSTPHLAGNLFMNMTGAKFIHVPYRGENLLVNDLLGGHVGVFFGGITPVLPYYRDGKLKILAVADARRAPLLPDVPTAAEAGLPGFISTSWLAVAGPPKMPRALAQQIAADFIAVVNMPDVQAKYRLIGIEPVGTTPAETAAFIRDEAARWREVILANHIRVE
jgi:tripartite-type tricarboxylate transporter receptor subunit TctC